MLKLKLGTISSTHLKKLLPNLKSSYHTPSTRKPIYPKRIIICRHGESKGNLSDKAYVTTPDWLIPLSKTGIEQGRALGRRLKVLVGDDPVYLYTSPYLRTKQTLAKVVTGGEFSEKQITGVREEPRLSEQQFGNFQDVDTVRRAKSERIKYGRFYYRFPLGESGLDVYNRASSFINTLFRDFGDRNCVVNENTNMILMTHGLTMRLLVMRFMRYTVADFERSKNAGNCGVVIMERNDDLDEQGGSAYDINIELDVELAQNGHLDTKPDKPTRYSLTSESRDVVDFPRAGKLQIKDLMREVEREGLGSFAEPAEHIKYWTGNHLTGVGIRTREGGYIPAASGDTLPKWK